MKKILIIITALILSGCKSQVKYYTHSFPDYFDTITTYITYATSSEEFDKQVKIVDQKLNYYDKLFDNYHAYKNINNLKSINEHASVSPIKIDKELYDLIDLSIQRHKEVSAKVNIAYGSVLSLWHDARSHANKNNVSSIPSKKELEEASKHTDINDIVLNKKESTIFLKDKKMSIDLGATAKGYAIEKIKESLIESGVTSFLLNGGGNVVGYGKRLVESDSDNKMCKKDYCIGIASPKDGNYASTSSDFEAILVAKNKAVVTSGDYERYFVDEKGKRYCHLIDPQTNYPAYFVRSVTVVTSDSALADYMSSALFLLSYKEAREIVESRKDIEAIWLLNDGTIKRSSGIRNSEFTVVNSQRLK